MYIGGGSPTAGSAVSEPAGRLESESAVAEAAGEPAGAAGLGVGSGSCEWMVLVRRTAQSTATNRQPAA
jgi:hypothetical protein